MVSSSRSRPPSDRSANSFQYLVNSWTTIVELLSIHKRLKAFEAAIDDEPLPEIDQRYLEREAAGVARGSAGDLTSGQLQPPSITGAFRARPRYSPDS